MSDFEIPDEVVKAAARVGYMTLRQNAVREMLQAALEAWEATVERQPAVHAIGGTPLPSAAPELRRIVTRWLPVEDNQ